MYRTLSIGEFSRLTHLSVKTLRYYHDIGLLLPASVAESTGYRRYTTGQVETAHLIRRLRAIDMPLDDLRSVLETLRKPDHLRCDADRRGRGNV